MIVEVYREYSSCSFLVIVEITGSVYIFKLGDRVRFQVKGNFCWIFSWYLKDCL